GAAAYLASLLEHDALVQVLDDQLKRDEYAEVVKRVTKIAINCLHLEGHTRPSMKEVTPRA
nr:wall-associated receptor kinase 2-like [Tanacetum cinerariifolium]